MIQLEFKNWDEFVTSFNIVIHVDASGQTSKCFPESNFREHVYSKILPYFGEIEGRIFVDVLEKLLNDPFDVMFEVRVIFTRILLKFELLLSASKL